MRVIAGTLRGRRLRAPPGRGTRPTSDRVREAVYSVLGSLLDLEGTSVVDLYAGSGAMGIEALSRGAASVVFVDNAPAACRALEANLGSLGLSERGRIVRQDVLRYLDTAPRFDVALCDPPYDFDAWDDVLSRLDAGVAVLESSRPPPVPDGWKTVKNKRYGGTLVTVARPIGASSTGSTSATGRASPTSPTSEEGNGTP
ncbi:MAG TPA: 16S rRNA (guanine(966)-N(2))-methyltransferase RsmD [Acidimicrobiales bacterium]|nr:16S rRNA (guanine(966)-N(2))-methyltransferase RsmD [Acidimicrobiales bacterium]